MLTEQQQPTRQVALAGSKLIEIDARRQRLPIGVEPVPVKRVRSCWKPIIRQSRNRLSQHVEHLQHYAGRTRKVEGNRRLGVERIRVVGSATRGLDQNYWLARVWSNHDDGQRRRPHIGIRTHPFQPPIQLMRPD